ncbi:hypothetical protein [Petrimonas sp.]|uniref:hypothetical protein n=1 Tax=Petrimonas sp. TaxID=2023866 RepID=UPI002B3D2475|nr:hypothetical protein [Petrimonas sp.]
MVRYKVKSNINMRSFKLIRGIVMVGIYLLVAYLLVFTPLFQGNISIGIRIAFGIIFTAYGIFRGYRLWKEQ